MTGDVQIFTVAENPGCIACAFSIEALAAALQENLFPLCAAHLVRLNVHLADEIGDTDLTPYLRAVLPDVRQ